MIISDGIYYGLPIGAQGFRRLRAATYFAHGGSSSQSPLDSVSAWWRKLRSFPCSSSSRRTHFVGLRREVRERLPKTPPGTAQGGHSVPTFAFPRTPVTGVTPWSRQNPSGAQNLSDDLNPRRATGPWVCKNCSCCGSTTAPGFAEPTCLVQNMGYLIRPLRGHLPLKGKAFKWHPPAFPFRGRWHAKRDG